MSLNVSPQRLIQACFLFCRAVSIGYSCALVNRSAGAKTRSGKMTQLVNKDNPPNPRPLHRAGIV
jgi:hypothetical protein